MGSTGDLIKVWPIETRGVLTDAVSGLRRHLCNEYARFSDSRNIDAVKYRSQSSTRLPFLFPQDTIAFSAQYQVVWRRGWCILLSILIPTRHQLSLCSTKSFGDVVDAFFFPFVFPKDASFHSAVPSRLAMWLMHSSFHSYSQKTPAFSVPYHVVWRRGWRILLSILIPRWRQLSQCSTMSFGDVVDAFFNSMSPYTCRSHKCLNVFASPSDNMAVYRNRCHSTDLSHRTSALAASMPLEDLSMLRFHSSPCVSGLVDSVFLTLLFFTSYVHLWISLA